MDKDLEEIKREYLSAPNENEKRLEIALQRHGMLGLKRAQNIKYIIAPNISRYLLTDDERLDSLLDVTQFLFDGSIIQRVLFEAIPVQYDPRDYLWISEIIPRRCVAAAINRNITQTMCYQVEGNIEAEQSYMELEPISYLLIMMEHLILHGAKFPDSVRRVCQDLNKVPAIGLPILHFLPVRYECRCNYSNIFVEICDPCGQPRLAGCVCHEFYDQWDRVLGYVRVHPRDELCDCDGSGVIGDEYITVVCSIHGRTTK